jgi:hypothetical protein
MTKKPKIMVDIKELQPAIAQQMSAHYYSKGGVRITPAWWSMLMQDRLYTSIRYDNVTQVDNDEKFEVLSIHTTWQGVDSREEKTGPPLIFETRVESNKHFWVWEAPNCEIAEVIHVQLLKQLQDGIPPEEIDIHNPLN